MIERARARKTLSRFNHMRQFPAGKVLQSPIIDELQSILTDRPGHVDSFVERILDSCDFFPSVRQIREAGRGTCPEASAGCRRCDWTGYRQVVLNGYSASQRCECKPEDRVPLADDEKSPEERRANARWAAETAKSLAQEVESVE